MKKKNNYYFYVGIIVIILILGLFNFKNNDKKEIAYNNNLINISNLTEEFMDNYFEGVYELQKYNNKENILIITSLNNISNTYGASKVVEAPNNQYFLQYDSEEEKNKALEMFNSDKNLISVEENTVFLGEAEYNSWGIEKMGLNHAISEANSKNLNNVVVAIIDCGLDVDLFNSFFDNKIAETYNLLEDSTSIMSDSVGHGTHIAGTIAEGTPDNVKILPIKISETLSFSKTDIVSAINYIIYNKKADVINMSFGSYTKSEAIEQAIEAASNNNIICVTSAGNKNTNEKHYPSGYNNTIGVSSIDSELVKASNSNYGEDIDFAAPGVSIKSINRTASGTSMAAPHVSSAVAILKSYNKNLKYTEVIDLLKQKTIDIGDIGWDEYYGYGYISFENTDFCDNNYCDAFGVYKGIDLNKEIKEIDIYELVYTKYNYLSITNLLASKVNITFKDGTSGIYLLDQIPNLEILNYNPSSSLNQTITIKTDTISIDVDVKNPDSYEIGWEYNYLDNNQIEITGYKSHELMIKNLYVPDSIDLKKVISFADDVKFNELGNDFLYYENIYLPDNFNKIGNYSFSNTNLKYVYGVNGVEVGKYAFDSSTLVNFNVPITKAGENTFANNNYLEKITISENASEIENYAFKNCSQLSEIYLLGYSITLNNNSFAEINDKVIFYIHNNSDVKQFLVNKNFEYRLFEPDDIIISNYNNTYMALQTVDLNNLSVKLIYHEKNDREEVLPVFNDNYGYILTYQNGDNFQFGDSYFILKTTNSFGYENIWNIDINITKIDLGIIDNSNDVTVKYDGNIHSIDVDIKSDLDIIVKYMDSNNEYLLDDVPKYKDIGRYIINYKVYYNDNYTEYIGQKVLTIKDNIPYTINNYKVDKINKYISNILINTEINSFTTNIILDDGYSLDIDSKEINNKKVLYTGGKTRITHGIELYEEYTNVVIGDINGDGKINSADLLRIRQHLLGTHILTGAYFLSSDINYDSTINSADLLRVRQHLLGIKPI